MGRIATAIWIGIVWKIWSIRNEVVFKNAPIDLEREISVLKATVWH